jgi:TctA family transporter
LPANRPRIGYTLGVMLWIVGLFIFVLNLPFGFWRARVQRFSAQWLLAIHLPIPIVVACRVFSGLGWHVTTFPVMIGAFFLGQFVGGKLVGNQ